MEFRHDVVDAIVFDVEFPEDGSEYVFHLGFAEVVEADGEVDSGLHGDVEGGDAVCG